MATERQSYIDVLRGLAVLAVVLFHYTERIPYKHLGYDQPLLGGIFSWGWIGPYWFFIVSGYCMAASIERTRDAIEFLGKRVSRIYPAYAVAILLILLFFTFVPAFSDPTAHYNTALVTFPDVVANFLFATDLGFDWIDGAFWTLLVELKFYLFLALLYFWICSKKMARVIGLLSLASAVLGVAWLVIRFVFQSAGPAQIADSVLTQVLIAPYLPFFALGLAVIEYRTRRSSSFLVAMITLSLVCCAVVLVAGIGNGYEHEKPLLSVGVFAFISLLFYALTGGEAVQRLGKSRPARLLSRPFLYLGSISYTWYLVHQDIGISTIFQLNRQLPDWAALIGAMALTIFLAELLRWSVEWRFRKPVELAFSWVFRWPKVLINRNNRAGRPAKNR